MSSVLPPMSDKTAPALAPALPAGTRVGPYLLERLLHEGPFGFVYLARSEESPGEALALKEFFPRVLAQRQEDGNLRARHAGDAIALSVAREAFRDEASALAAIHHPGLVPVRDTFMAFRTLWRAMPLVPGRSLAHWVDQKLIGRGEQASVRELRSLLEGLLAPLQALHAAGIMHRHVRPEQLLVADGARPGELKVVLLGFGAVARELGAVGDGPWSAPEALRGARANTQRVTSAADLYSVAACAWFAATGVTPPGALEREDGVSWHVAQGLEALTQAPGDPPSARQALVAAIEAALAMAPEARPQRVVDFRRLLAGEPPMRLVSPQRPPLWMGETPDPDEQRSMIGPRSADEPMPAPKARVSEPGPLESPVSVLPARSDWTPLETVERVPSGPTPFDAIAEGPPGGRHNRPKRRAYWPWLAAAAVLAAAVAAIGWAVSSYQGPLEVAVAPVLETPAASAPASEAAASAVAAAPATVVSEPALPATPAAASATAVEPAASASAPLVTAATATAAAVPVVTAAAVASGGKASASTKPAASTRASNGKAAKSNNKPRSTPAANKPTVVAPRTACAGRTEFSQLRCLQEQCSRASLRNHPQCVELRRSGDIR